MKPLILMSVLALLPATASAQTPPDARLRTLPYNPDAVTRLDGCRNFQTMISFAADEHIENVGLGDSSQWQVMPNKRGDLLFVKPLAADAFSNMTVVSDKRVYNFELRAAPEADCRKGQVVYDLRFSYPADKAAASAAAASAALPPPAHRNTAYTYSGAADLAPLRVFDDGSSTFMRWADGVATPAIYALGADGSESLVNYAQRDDYLVVEQVARAFVLRRGAMKTVLYNDDFRTQGLDAESPQPRAKDQGPGLQGPKLQGPGLQGIVK